MEMLFSFSITMMLTMFSIPLVNLSLAPSLMSQAGQLIVYVNYAKSYAINTRQKVELDFSNGALQLYNQDTLLDEYRLTKADFSKELHLWFNENGNINQANSIYLKNSSEQVKLTFNLGTGNCYAQ